MKSIHFKKIMSEGFWCICKKANKKNPLIFHKQNTKVKWEKESSMVNILTHIDPL